MALKSGVLLFYVNGKKVEDDNVDPSTTLLQYLRQKLHLRGTKEGCGTGGCGACTVMLSWCEHGSAKKIHHCAINACLTPICLVHGKAVTTTEGIGSTKTALHPVQERIAKAHGTQCGFCTPGFVMSMYALLRNNPQPSMDKFLANFQGNLCRCTGYRPILDGLKTFTKEFQCCQSGNCPGKDAGCCGGTPAHSESEAYAEIESSLTQVSTAPYDPTQEPIFPPQLQLWDGYQQNIMFCGKLLTWIRPGTLREALKAKQEHPSAILVAGNTSIGFFLKSVSTPKTVIAIGHLPELLGSECTDSGFVIGAGVTLTKLEEILKESLSKFSDEKVKLFKAVLAVLRWFAGPQIRNVATLGGSLVAAGSKADLNALWTVAGVTVDVLNKDGRKRTVTVDSSFFVGRGKTVLAPDDIVVSFHLPFSEKNDFFYVYKQSHRREFDLAIVIGAFRLVYDSSAGTVTDIRMSYGGIGSTTVSARRTAQALIGMHWNEEMLETACNLLTRELKVPMDDPGGLVQYRNMLMSSLFFKFYLFVLDEMKGANITDEFAEAKIERGKPKTSQVFEVVKASQPEQDPIGRPLVHFSALEHATGEAVYCDDTRLLEDELHLVVVTSKKAHAKISSVDAADALLVDGVVAYIDHGDVPGQNLVGAGSDEPVFAEGEVNYYGQIVGAVAAKSREAARQAAKLVKIQYEELPVVITIEQAIEANSYFEEGFYEIHNGDVDNALTNAKHVLEGEFRAGGQQHFYMENQSAICMPLGEKMEMEILSSTQTINYVQEMTSKTLGIPRNKLTVKVKRVGGGFGGKELQCILCSGPCAVAAHKLQRPVRCIFSRDDDFLVTGGRHKALYKYKIGFDDTGKVQALDVKLYLNSGYSREVSPELMQHVLFGIDGCYKIPNLRFYAACCKTNLASATPLRAAGYPQSTLFIEHCMQEVSRKLAVPNLQVREVNLFHQGDTTWWNMPITDEYCQNCFDECVKISDYQNRRAAVDAFNVNSRWKKRGLCLLPVRFGIPFFMKSACQASALVHVYTDGSVMLTFGGIELGQGIHIKMLQVASRVLEIPIEMIHLSVNSTDKIANSSASSGSSTTDLCGPAVLKACLTIVDRLKPYKTAKPDDSWAYWVKAAYFDRVNLSATGFHAPECGEYNWKTKEGYGNLYLTYGAACSEVEIDALTGDHVLLRTDIVMDVGQSLNPAIDIGQIEGGFLQGYGYVTLEEIRWTEDGVPITRNPGTYKIPGFNDIPVEFNVALLRNASNPKAIYSSKGIGEPPLMLGSSAFFAIKDAVFSARKDAGCQDDIAFHPPATAEKICISCGTNLKA